MSRNDSAVYISCIAQRVLSKRTGDSFHFSWVHFCDAFEI